MVRRRDDGVQLLAKSAPTPPVCFTTRRAARAGPNKPPLRRGACSAAVTQSRHRAPASAAGRSTCDDLFRSSDASGSDCPFEAAELLAARRRSSAVRGGRARPARRGGRPPTFGRAQQLRSPRLPAQPDAFAPQRGRAPTKPQAGRGRRRVRRAKSRAELMEHPGRRCVRSGRSHLPVQGWAQHHDGRRHSPERRNLDCREAPRPSTP